MIITDHLMRTISSGVIPFKYFHLCSELYFTTKVSPSLSGYFSVADEICLCVDGREVAECQRVIQRCVADGPPEVDYLEPLVDEFLRFVWREMSVDASDR